MTDAARIVRHLLEQDEDDFSVKDALHTQIPDARPFSRSECEGKSYAGRQGWYAQPVQRSQNQGEG